MRLGGESMISCSGDAAVATATVLRNRSVADFQNISCVKIRYPLLLPKQRHG
jgi:hypothetical protein